MRQSEAGDPAETLVGWLRPGGPGDVAAQTAGWGSVEWAKARQAALVHGVAPLLAWRLAGTPAWEALAPELRAYCAEQLELNTRRVALMFADLGAIAAAAAAAGVEIVALKGAPMALRYYPEPALRPMADLDVLARPADEPRLARAIGAIGFRLVENTPRHRAYARGEQRVVSYDGEHPDNPRGVEVHTEIAERLHTIDYTITPALWRGATPLGGAAGPALAPPPEGLLLHLLIHTSHNIIYRRLRLIQLYDIALLAPQIVAAAWGDLVDGALRAGEARLLYAPLALAERLFGPLAPAPVLAELAAGTPLGLRRLIERSTPSDLSLCNPREVSLGYRLAWHRSGAAQLRATLRMLAAPPDAIRQHYPHSARLALAYLYHLRHLGAWGLRWLFQRPRRPAQGGR